MKQLTHGALFNGIAGFPLAASKVGIKTVWHSEIDKFCNKAMDKNFPWSKSLGDIRDVNRESAERVDIISCGFPCQPWSNAGKREGKKDARWLGEEMLRVFTELRPPYLFLENVTGFIRMALDELLTSLESLGYETESFVVPACAVGAPHKRERLWIIAYSNSNRKSVSSLDAGKGQQLPATNSNCFNGRIEQQFRCGEGKRPRNESERSDSKVATDSQHYGCEGRQPAWWGEQERNWATDSTLSPGQTRFTSHSDSFNSNRGGYATKSISFNGQGTLSEEFRLTEPPVRSPNDGVSPRLARNIGAQLRGYGNAIVPQVAIPFFQAIQQHANSSSQ